MKNSVLLFTIGLLFIQLNTLNAYSQDIKASSSNEEKINTKNTTGDIFKLNYYEGLKAYKEARNKIDQLSLENQVITIENFTGIMETLWSANLHLKKVIAADPNNGNVHIDLGNINIAFGDLATALNNELEYMSRQIAGSMHDNTNYLNSDKLSDKSQLYYQKAEESFNKYSEIYQYSGFGYYSLAKLNNNTGYKNGDYAIVQKHIGKAIEIEPKNPEYYNFRGNLNLANLESNLNIYLKLNSKRPDNKNELNDDYFKIAHSDYQKAISINPKKGIYYNNLAYLFSLKNQNKEALDNFNKAIRLEPENKHIVETYKKILVSTINESPDKTSNILKDLTRQG